VNKKYKLIPAPDWKYMGKQLHRVQALIDFAHDSKPGGVKAGEKGGLVEGEHNLSHEGDCWIADNAMVMDKAVVCDDAYVGGKAMVKDYARIGGAAVVKGSVRVTHKATVIGLAYLDGKERIGGLKVVAYPPGEDGPLTSELCEQFNTARSL